MDVDRLTPRTGRRLVNGPLAKGVHDLEIDEHHMFDVKGQTTSKSAASPRLPELPEEFRPRPAISQDSMDIDKLTPRTGRRLVNGPLANGVHNLELDEDRMSGLETTEVSDVREDVVMQTALPETTNANSRIIINQSHTKGKLSTSKHKKAPPSKQDKGDSTMTNVAPQRPQWFSSPSPGEQMPDMWFFAPCPSCAHPMKCSNGIPTGAFERVLCTRCPRPSLQRHPFQPYVITQPELPSFSPTNLYMENLMRGKLIREKLKEGWALPYPTRAGKGGYVRLSQKPGEDRLLERLPREWRPEAGEMGKFDLFGEDVIEREDRVRRGQLKRMRAMRPNPQ